MTNWQRQIEAGLATIALALTCMPPSAAQNSPQVSNTPQGGFTLQANAELVLTNVVARDAKTGE